MKHDNRPVLDTDSWQLTAVLLSKLRIQKDYTIEVDAEKPAQEINPDLFHLFDVWIIHMTGKSMKDTYINWTERDILEYVMEQYVKYKSRILVAKPHDIQRSNWATNIFRMAKT